MNLFSLNSQRFELSDGRLIREIGHVGALVDPVRSSVDLRTDDSPSLGSWWSAYLSGARPISERATGRRIRSVDLFCGAGGLALGLRQALDELGMDLESVLAVDQDQGALNVYQHNHGTNITSTTSVDMLVTHQINGRGDGASLFTTPRVARDIAHLRGTIDMLMAGPPCQGHSNLNNHSRRNDVRNSLYLDVPAIAIALEIPHVIIENVPGVVHDHQSVVSSTISILSRAGYRIESGVLSASEFGWPQTRRRFFLVASMGSSPVPFSDLKQLLGVPGPLSVWWAIGALESRSTESFMDQLPALSVENQRRVEYLVRNDLHDLPLTERPECHRNGTSYLSVYGRMHKDRPAPTITGGFLSPGRGRFTHPTQPRVLTPREAARLQGFPDGYWFGSEFDPPPPRTHLARWIGNAVPMPLGFAAALSALLPTWRA